MVMLEVEGEWQGCDRRCLKCGGREDVENVMRSSSVRGWM